MFITESHRRNRNGVRLHQDSQGSWVLARIYKLDSSVKDAGWYLDGADNTWYLGLLREETEVSDSCENERQDSP